MSMIDHTQIEPIEKASLDELQALQLSRMKWSLQHAYDNVAHYRKRFEEAGMHPGDLQTLSDLGKFPLTAKQDLRENYPFDLFAVPMDEVVRIHASSGTTGKPKYIPVASVTALIISSIIVYKGEGSRMESTSCSHYCFCLFRYACRPALFDLIITIHGNKRKNTGDKYGLLLVLLTIHH